jgi:hypothetical protein
MRKEITEFDFAYLRPKERNRTIAMMTTSTIPIAALIV